LRVRQRTQLACTVNVKRESIHEPNLYPRTRYLVWGLETWSVTARDGLTVVLVVTRENVFDEAREALAGRSVKRRDGARICYDSLYCEPAAHGGTYHS
jgi:hypothetical protein